MGRSAGLARSVDVPTVPFYQQIMDDIRRRIAAGDLEPGDQLPPTRELAEQYDVGVTTAREAVNRLILLGVLRGHQGLGVFVADEPD